MPRLLPLVLALALLLAFGGFPASLANPRTDIPTPVVPSPPAVDSFAQTEADARSGEKVGRQTLPETMRAQRPTVDVNGTVVEGEPVEAEVTVDIAEEEGVPVEVSPSESEGGSPPGAVPVEEDSDGDYVPNLVDNCPMVSNVRQEDSNGDGVGDGCPVVTSEAQRGSGESDSDFDGDGIPDASDNCWRLANASQKDGDGDGLGNGCDEGSAPYAEGDAPAGGSEPAAESSPPEDAGATGGPAAPVVVIEGGDSESAPTADEPPAERPDEPESDASVSSDAPPEEANAPRREPETGSTERAEAVPAPGGEVPTTRTRKAPTRQEAPASAWKNPTEPRSRDAKKRSAKPVAYEVMTRINAGALGTRDRKAERQSDDSARRRSRDETAATRQRDQKGATDETRGPAQSNAANEDRRGPARSDAASDAGQRAGDNGSRREPVPIEAGAIIPNNPAPPDAAEPLTRKSAGADGETGEAAALPDGLVRGTILGWTEPPSGDEEPGDGGATTAGSDKADSDRQRPSEAVEPGPAWSPDRGYRGGEATRLADGGEVAGTAEDDLFLTQRAGTDRDRDGAFVYTIPIAEDGIYRVRLFFAETWFGAPGGGKGRARERMFNVDAEGEPALRDFDIFAEAGAMQAVVQTFDVEVDDGKLELEFLPVCGRPVVSAIEVLRPLADEKDKKRDRPRDGERSAAGKPDRANGEKQDRAAE